MREPAKLNMPESGLLRIRRNAPRLKHTGGAAPESSWTQSIEQTPWPKEDPDRRLIARFDFTDKGLDGRRILTNFKSYTAEQLYKMYCSRGESEKWIGETKNCFQLRFNSQSFNANQFRLLIHALAYTLMSMLRTSFSPPFWRQSIESVRKNFIEIPVAIIRKSKWKLRWQLTKRYTYQTEFLRVCRKLNRAM